MGMILAYAFAAFEGRGGGVLHVARAGLIAHRSEHRIGERLDSCPRIFGAFHCLVCERAQRRRRPW